MSREFPVPRIIADTFSANTFYGGANRGLCLQLTSQRTNQYLQFNITEAVAVVAILAAFAGASSPHWAGNSQAHGPAPTDPTDPTPGAPT